MKTTFNSDLIPSYELNELETEELEQTGYCIVEDGDFCIVKIDGQLLVFKVFDEYESLKLYGGKR